jgi:hypothetical protein
MVIAWALLPCARGQADIIMPLEPLVYTGAYHGNESNQSMLARMFLIPGGNHGPFEAHLILYHGSFDTREYVPVIFDKVERQENGSYLLTSLRMTGGGMPMRHPVVEINVPGGDVIEGIFDSGMQTRVGVLRLAKGWELPAGTMTGRRIVPAFEGRYFGDCAGGPRSDLLTGLELYSTRSQLDDIALMPAVDTAVEANTYQGGTICRDPDGFGADRDLTCAGFPSGNYDLYTGKLNLFVTSAWRWTCDWDEKSDMLTCDTRRFGRECEMYRIREPEVSMSRDTRGIAPYGLGDTDARMMAIKADLKAKDPASKPGAPAIKCVELGRKFPGVLHHMYTGLYQRVALDLGVIEPAPGVCKISGMIAQGFDKSDSYLGQPLTHVIETSKYEFKEEVFRIASGPMGDAVLILKREGYHFSGYWYSRLFGLVGRVEFGEGLDLGPIPDLEFVPTVAGLFDSPPQNGIRMHRKLELKPATDGGDFRSFNPIRQLPTIGLLRSEVISPDGDGYGLQTMQEVRHLVYDYFTGRVSFNTQSAEYYGPVLPRGMILRMLPTNDNANYIPYGIRWEYTRVGRP